VGAVVLRGVELSEPCVHLVELTGKQPLLSTLIHRGGLHAQIVTDGVIHLHDLIELVEGS
jgi:MOSC domain-containing protein YiiM